MLPVKQSAVIKVRNALEEEINGGLRQPGEPLDERELMERFKVSRTPVRSAILQLASHGLITILPRSGTYVARMSAHDLLSMLEVLAELEAACAKLAARRLSTADRQELKTLHEKARLVAENQDNVAYDRYNSEWHGLIYSGSLNSYLREQILSIRRRTKVYRCSVFEEPNRIRTSYADHQKIVDAIVAGEPEQAHRHMLEHIAGSSKDFLELLAHIPGDDSNKSGRRRAT
jgi:DNA-binding GntR family transcriptional regulator